MLDPWDIYMLQKGTGRDLNSLLESELKLRVAEGLILPCINMPEEDLLDSYGCIIPGSRMCCAFLDSKARCSIHEYRPGFCRLFPLGRIYEDDSFDYFVQIDECPYPNKSKVKIKKWLGIPNLAKYEQYILHYHNLCKKITSKFTSDTSEAVMKSTDMMFLKVLFTTPYDTEGDFYEQYYSRTEQLSTLFS